METRHTVRSFGDELDRLRELVLQMMKESENQVTRSLEVLFSGDEAQASDVESGDSVVDQLERDIQDLSVTLLAFREPKAVDFRTVVAATRMAADLERIADYAVNIARRAPFLKDNLSQELIDDIRRAGESVRDMMNKVREAFEANDSAKAMEAWRQDDEVDHEYSKMLDDARTKLPHEPAHEGLEIHSHLVLLAKSLERIGDHLTNVAEHVFFLVEGKQMHLVMSD